MKRRWRWVLCGALILAVFVTGLFAFRVELSELSFDMALSQLEENGTERMEDGIHIYICGAGSPLSDPKRGGSCIGVLAGEDAFVFDAGSGGSRTLTSMGFPFHKLQRIFITHYHSDHIDGLGELLLQAWIAGRRTSPVPVAGPTGIGSVLDGFLDAYALDRSYRIEHHGEDLANPAGFGGVAAAFELVTDWDVVYDVNEVTVTAFHVDHHPVLPAVGYRVDYGSRSVVISGDTDHDKRIIEAARDADLLIHEALNREMVKRLERVFTENGSTYRAQIMRDIQDYHASPVEAAQIAQEAEVGELLLYHIIPPLRTSLLHPMFLEGVSDHYDGNATIAEDGMLISLPISTKSTNYRMLGP